MYVFFKLPPVLQQSHQPRKLDNGSPHRVTNTKKKAPQIHTTLVSTHHVCILRASKYEIAKGERLKFLNAEFALSPFHIELLQYLHRIIPLRRVNQSLQDNVKTHAIRSRSRSRSRHSPTRPLVPHRRRYRLPSNLTGLLENTRSTIAQRLPRS